MDIKSISQLKLFVNAITLNPSLLHDPSLSFFKEYLVSLGAEIPPAPEKVVPEPPKPEPEAPETEMPEPKIPEPEPKIPEPEPKIPEPTPEPMDDSSDEEVIELDNSGVIAAEALLDLPMGDTDKECSDEDIERADDLRGQAMCNMSDGNLDEAKRLFGEAIQSNPHAAVLFAKRAQLLLREKMPVNAIRDAEKALSLNPNNALAHKCKGKGLRLLGKWEDSLLALGAGQRCDYDDDTQELLKTIVKPNAEKLRQARLKKASKQREREHSEKLERVRIAREERQRKYDEAKANPDFMDDDISGGMPEGMGGLFDDPELALLLQDPEVVEAMKNIQENPANMMQYMSNPKVMKVVQKLQGKYGGGGMGGMPGGMPGGMGGMPGGMPAGFGGMPGGFGGMPGGMGGMPGGMAGAPPPAAAPTAPPPTFTTSCDDVD